MRKRLHLLAVQSPRGDLGLIAKAIDLAQRKDVGAHAIVFLGNFCGPLLGGGSFTLFQHARTTLQSELDRDRTFYQRAAVESAWQLADFVLRTPDQPAPLTSAAKVMREAIGAHDDAGKLVDLGTAGVAARSIYQQALRIFSGSPAPCYLMADTSLAESVLPESQWLQFSWFTLAGYSIGGLGASELSDADAITEYAPGPRRKGQVVRMDEIPFARADILLASEPSPMLQEILGVATKQLAVFGGPGEMMVDERENVSATQKPGMAYLYRLQSTRVERVPCTFENGLFRAGEPEWAREQRKDVKRTELEGKMKLAGVGKDLVLFLDLVRKRNPAFAEKIELSANRSEVIFQYIQSLEENQVRLEGVLSAERAGFERLVQTIALGLSAEHRERIHQALGRRPGTSATVEEIDAANLELARLLEAALAPPASAPTPDP